MAPRFRSLSYIKKGIPSSGKQPLMLYGYGAYATTITPNFSTMRLSALDRGFTYAVAHVRGGSMMGYQWYFRWQAQETLQRL